ncbi:MAG: sugar ABC transporter permease [Chloroflexi bacterium]|nr:sugar ABC transporter permease [Chloroflexota bacterium]
MSFSTLQTRAASSRIVTGLGRVFSDRYAKFYLVVPVILYLLLIGIFPLIFSFGLSFLHWDVAAQRPMSFAGLANYAELLRDSRFLKTFLNTIIFVIGAITFEVIFGFGLALLLNREIRGQGIFRVLLMLPMMATPVAVGYTWRMLYHVTNGPINHILRVFHLPTGTWLSSGKTSLLSIIITDVWQWTPFVFIILLAGLQSLPREPFEAAAVDGASRVQIFFYLTLPMIWPIMVIAILLRMVEAIKIFDIVFVMTAGGPGISTETSTMYARLVSLTQFRLGYGAAIAYVLMILSAIIFIILTRVLPTEVEME